MSAPLFDAQPFRALEIEAADVPALQRYYEENPEYAERVYGRRPRANDAAQELAERPPPGWPYTAHWLMRFTDGESPIVARDRPRTEAA